MHLIIQLHGKKVAGDAHRTSSSALTACYTAACQVHGPQDMPFHVPMGIGLNGDPLGLVDLHIAPGAVTHRACLAACVAFNAL